MVTELPILVAAYVPPLLSRPRCTRLASFSHSVLAISLLQDLTNIHNYSSLSLINSGVLCSLLCFHLPMTGTLSRGFLMILLTPLFGSSTSMDFFFLSCCFVTLGRRPSYIKFKKNTKKMERGLTLKKWRSVWSYQWWRQVCAYKKWRSIKRVSYWQLVGSNVRPESSWCFRITFKDNEVNFPPLSRQCNEKTGKYLKLGGV